MSNRRRITFALLVTTAVVAVAGCGSGASADDQVADWLDAVCAGAKVERAFTPDSKNVAKAGGTPEAKAACDRKGKQVEAYVYPDDPGSDYVSVMDSWESGDGTDVTFATAELDDGRHGGVFVFTSDTALLDPLEEEFDDLDWEIISTHDDD